MWSTERPTDHECKAIYPRFFEGAHNYVLLHYILQNYIHTVGYLAFPFHPSRAKYPNFDRLRVNFYHMRYGL